MSRTCEQKAIVWLKHVKQLETDRLNREKASGITRYEYTKDGEKFTFLTIDYEQRAVIKG